MITSLSRNGKNPNDLLLQSTIFVFLNPTILLKKHSYCTGDQLLNYINFNKSTRVKIMLFGCIFRSRITIHLRRLYCGNCSQSFGFEANASKDVCFLNSEAENMSSAAFWYSLLNPRLMCEVQSAFYSQGGPVIKHLP